MNTPGCLAVNFKVVFSPGAIVLNAVSGFSSEEWKSIECGTRTCIALLLPLNSAISTWSPCSTTIGAETPFPRLNSPLTA